eukprot:7262511-Prorocentrum_lima.AAC.1
MVWVERIAAQVSLTPGYKVLVIGGSSDCWKCSSLFNEYASHARHFLVSLFDRAERRGESPL